MTDIIETPPVQTTITTLLSNQADWALAYRDGTSGLDEFLEQVALATLQLAAFIHGLDSNDTRLATLELFPTDARRVVEHVMWDLIPDLVADEHPMDDPTASRILTAITAATLDPDKCPLDEFVGGVVE